jgi:1-deoxy-D-xylulose-5-phosphate reductoisomerase
MKKIAILGSTGSIGNSTLNVIEANPGVFSITLLTAESNVDSIFNQIKKFKPKYVYLNDDSSSKQLNSRLSSENLKTSLLNEKDYLDTIASNDVEIVVAGVVGIAGLKSIHKAVSAGKRILLANKEAYVVAGELLNALAELNESTIFPIDSEHSAIHQCLSGKKDTSGGVKKIILTGSGGPFLNRNLKEFIHITPEEAVMHPVWKMGKKISVDSATMMNKGLEVIEAKWLFKIDSEKIGILVHPEGIVHSLVEFEDASLLAQMSVPDMKIPIAYGLGFPERIRSNSQRLSLEKIEQLNFCKPDLKKFPSIGISRASLDSGGTSPSLLNAANEEAVRAFLDKKICFTQITEIISFVMDTIPIKTVKELENIFQADTLARKSALTRIHQLRS